ncbi:antitoxin [Mesorhizobium koreense]|jgi:antitoxin VapB|uniref:antitoxin n=1 Tax=Mesorhizobium koreense TaxID=3074855 RepID=UPI00287B6728|nr:AbrB/MazE/SpoVT family DNA-binding domain-containing protein [Mesorhizobium sp. WR6]
MNAHDKDVRTASLFRNGRSQAVRIPKEFEFEGDEVRITRDEKGKLIVEEIRKKPTLLEVLATLEPLGPEDRFPDIDDSDLLPLDDIKL